MAAGCSPRDGWSLASPRSSGNEKAPHPMRGCRADRSGQRGQERRRRRIMNASLPCGGRVTSLRYEASVSVMSACDTARRERRPVVCAEEDDLRTLETALLTRKLRADVRVVVQLTNPAVGRALSQIEISVLDTAGLAAPSIVEACVRTGQDVWLSGEQFTAVRTTAPRAASLRELYGDLAPVAVVPAAGGNAEICPGRDHEVAPADEVTLIGTPAALDGAGLSDRADRPASPVLAMAARQVSYVRQLALSMLRAVDRRLGWALAALFAVVIVSTAVLRLAYQADGSGRHLSVLDAAYFAVETVTTVGYGDYSFRDQPAWLIAGATGLMLAGALFVAVFFP